MRQPIEGSYGYDDAMRIVYALLRAFKVEPTVRQVRTMVSNQPTDWYQICVHKKWITRVQDFVCGWQAGNEAGLDRAYGRDELAAVGNLSRAVASLRSRP
jgi:hypothetical protein